MRKALPLMGLFLVVLVPAGAQGAAPRVVRSNPADGAVDVPVDFGLVVVVFDQAMDQAGWTLDEAAGVAFPPIVENGASWSDARTFVLRLERLKPNTKYAIQLNTAQRKGFAAAAGEALPVTTLAFTTGAGTSRPAVPVGYRIINAVDDFLAYHDRSKDLPEAQRLENWDSLLEAKHRDFFQQVIYRKKEGEDRERYKRDCVRRFWTEVVPKLDAIRKLNAAAAGEIVAVTQEFQKQFPDFKPSTDFYVAISFSFGGKVVGLNGKDIFAIGLEHFEPGQPQLRITIAHELFHLYHFQTFSTAGELYRSLWAEGLATYASEALVPGHRLSVYLGFPVEKMNRCQELLPALAKDLRQKMDETGQQIKRIYFGAEPNDTQVPPEAGYYVGYQVVRSLAAKQSLADLARMEAKAVRTALETELGRLAAP